MDVYQLLEKAWQYVREFCGQENIDQGIVNKVNIIVQFILTVLVFGEN